MALGLNTKRVQLDKDKTSIIVIVSIASIVAVAALVIGKGLWNQTNYLGRVADKKEAAVRTLEANKKAVAQLAESYKTFDEQSPNLIGGTTTGTGERDGTNGGLVLDALPSKYDFPALTASLEKLLGGYAINNISGTDDNLNQAGAAGGYVEIPFAVNVTAGYEDFKKLITTFDHSIRPFKLTKVSLTGNNGSLQTRIDARTYFQPETGLKITEETVK